MSRPRIALVTTAEARPLDEDLVPLERALHALGADAEPACWDDASVDWSAFQLALVRSPWDYTWRYRAFLDWVRRVDAQTSLFNPAGVLRWNTDKRYLAELARAGAEVVSTWYLEPGDAAVLPGELHGELVVKPAVSAGSKNTGRYDARQPSEREQASRHIEELLAAARVVMIQPYLAAVDQQGETALVYLDGAFSHAIRKGPMLSRSRQAVAGLFAPERISPRRPRPEELACGARVIESLSRIEAVARSLPLLYARIDLIDDERGEPRLLELELTEPSLFLDERAAEKLARATLARLG